jgi:hypothetical protein
MGQGLGRRAFTAASLATALAILAPAGAHAGKIEGLVYTAQPGEENHLEISYDYEAQVFRFHDSGVSFIQPGSYGDCTVVANTASCPMDWSGQVVARLGDGSDSAVIANQLPYIRTQSNLYSGSVQMIGGDGNDVLDAGPGIPFSGTLITSTFVSLWGDGFPSDPLNRGQGDDVLIGGVGEDGFIGGPGNDLMVGKAGRDSFDGSPFYSGGPDAHLYAAGADTMDGGVGSDTFNGLESGSAAADTITCGSGEEGPLIAGFLPGRDMEIPGDAVALGAGDSVATDCEGLATAVVCPESLDRPCVGAAVIEGVASGSGRAAVTSKRRKAGRKVVVGAERFKAAPGRLLPVRVGLRPKRVNRLLGRRPSAKVSQRATARSGRKRLKLDRKRFILRRG